MQFFPIASDKGVEGLFGAALDGSSEKSKSELFAEMIGQLMPQAQAAQTASGLPGAAAVPDTSARNLTVTGDEFDKMKQSLLDFGLTPKDLEEISASVHSPEGMTWEQFSETVGEKVSRAEETRELTPVQKQHLNSFLQKLGFSPEQMAQIAAEIARGNRSSALAEISAAVKSLPADRKIGIGQEELGTVMQLLGASATAKNRVSQFVALKGGELGQKDLSSAIGMLKEDMLRRQAAKTEGLGKLRDMIDSAYADAKAAAKRMKLADRRQDSTPKEMMLKAENARDRRDRVESDKSAAAHAKDRHVKTEERASDGKDGRVIAARSEKDVDDNTRDAKVDPRHSVQARVLKSQAAEGQAGSRKDEQPAWGDFLSKLKADPERLVKKDSVTGFESVAAAAMRPGQALAAQQMTAGAEKLASRQILSQVQSGLLSNLSNGAQRLTLELTPENLGKLNIVLQVHNKELKAVIKSDNPETSRVLAEQMAAIRETLEQQGLKVAKLEIQTSLPQNDYSGGSRGADQHNQARNEAEQAMLRARMRSLRSSGEGLAQGLQDRPRTAISSQSGLDVFA